MIKFSKNRKAKLGDCILKIDGVPCNEYAGCRGFCRSCYTHLQRRGLLDKFGHARRDGAFKYALDQGAAKNYCRIKVNSESCGRESFCRGLCSTHYNKFRGGPEAKKFMLKKQIKGKDY